MDRTETIMLISGIVLAIMLAIMLFTVPDLPTIVRITAGASMGLFIGMIAIMSFDKLRRR